jgi:hypothetical protein
VIVKLVKKPDDPECVRMSAGGTPAVGYYGVFRGDKAEVIVCLREVLRALENGAKVEVEGD